MISQFGSRPNLCYDAVVETLSTINNTSLPKSPSESSQYPLSRMQRNKCMFVNQLMAEAMMEMVDESKVQSCATQQLINVFRVCLLIFSSLHQINTLALLPLAKLDNRKATLTQRTFGKLAYTKLTQYGTAIISQVR